MIIFCHLLNDRSGSPTVLRATLDALDASQRGLLYVGSQGRGVLDDSGVPIRRYWYRRSRYRLVTLVTFLTSQLALYRGLSRATDIPRDAVVFVNTLLPFGAMLWAKRTGRRIVVHAHEVSITPSPLRRFLTGCVARSASLLLYVSNDHRARLPIDGPPTLIVPNPVSPTLVAQAKTGSRVQDGRFRVLMLASFRTYKGISEFLNLAQDLQTRTDIAFDLVLNADVSELAAFTARYSGLTNVAIHPRTDDPGRFYLRSNLVLNLSRVDEWIETFGLTLTEAMTFGLPVIAPPIGGPTEIVTHGIEGFCIDSRDRATLQEAVLRLVDEPDTYKVMAKAARKRARDFDFDSYSTKLRTAVTRLKQGEFE